MNAEMNAAIAQHLNIAKSLIKSVEEWTHVLFVRFTFGRPRFVSKKVVKVRAKQAWQIKKGDVVLVRQMDGTKKNKVAASNAQDNVIGGVSVEYSDGSRGDWFNSFDEVEVK